MILGITGPIASGKGTLAELLQKKGFQIYSLSDMLRNEAKRQGVGIDRPTMTPFANALREKNGPSFLAKMVLEEIQKDGHKDVAVESIRNPHEVEELKAAGAIIIGISADPKVRFERLFARGREGDAKTYEEFLLSEEKENTAGDASQQLTVCYKMSDHFLDNNGGEEELQQQLDALLETLSWKK